MPIRFACSACSVAIDAPDNAAGKTTKCPQCGAELHIPGPAVQVQPANQVKQTPPTAGFQPGPPTGYVQQEEFRKPESSNGTIALVLGIVGVLITLVAPAAIFVGRSARKQDPNDGKALAGYVLGWVGSGLLVFQCCLIVPIIAIQSIGTKASGTFSYVAAQLNTAPESLGPFGTLDQVKEHLRMKTGRQPEFLDITGPSERFSRKLGKQVMVVRIRHRPIGSKEQAKDQVFIVEGSNKIVVADFGPDWDKLRRDYLIDTDL